MKVIFLSDVPRVGKKNDIKEVNDGYAVNFLLPRKLVQVATPKAVSNLEQRKKDVIVEREVQEDLLTRNLEEINGKSVTLKVKADDKGHLFSAVHKSDIVDAMQNEHRAKINEDFIVLEKPIKEIGEFDIKISIKNKSTSFKLIVEKV